VYRISRNTKASGNSVGKADIADPAAQWTGAMRGPAFFAYADNYLIGAPRAIGRV
jgi:hypothetical protein